MLRLFPVSRTSLVPRVILASHEVPIGRLTPEFENSLGEFFSTHSPLAIAQTVLTGSPLGQLPDKIRAPLTASITSAMSDLNTAEFLAVLAFLKSNNEDILFEAWMKELGAVRASALSKDQIKTILVNVLKLHHLIHPCKDVAICRLFESLKTLTEETAIETFLTVAGDVLSRERLAHPTIRDSCITLLNRIPNASTMIYLSSRLPVFPEMRSAVEKVTKVPTKPSELILGIVGFLQSEVSVDLAPWLKNCKDLRPILERCVTSRSLNRATADQLLAVMGWDQNLTNEAIGGLANLVSKSQQEIFLKIIFPKLQTPLSLATALAVYSKIPNCPHFETHVKPHMSTLSPKHVQSLSQFYSTDLEKNFSLISDPRCVAVMVRSDQGPAVERLKELMKKEQNLDRVLVVQKILEAHNGAHSNKEILRQITRQVWNMVRMAKIVK